MKKFFAVFLLAALLIPACALAYVDAVSGATLTESAPITGRLNARMATRTGPGTKYEEPGTFFAAGDSVTIISMGYSSVPWVQVEARIGGRLMRVYTGFKRIDGVRESDVPQEANYDIPARLSMSVTPTYGPGAKYAKYGFSLGAGKRVTIIDFEGDYAMCDYEESGGDWRRVWIPESALDY